MVKIIKDNVILSIKEEELAQYESRGFKRMEEVEKTNTSKNTKTEKK